MSQDRLNHALDELAELTAQQILFTVAPGATSDPLSAVKRLLLEFLDQAQEQLSQEALSQQSEEQSQEN